MENSEALRIVRALADGVNPATGETFEADAVFQQPETIRALERAAAALQSHVETLDRNRKQPAGIEQATVADTGKPWLPEEDEQLCLEFYHSVDFDDIANHLGRARRAIISRLVKLGKIKPKAVSSVA